MKTLSLIVLCLGLSLATLAQAPKAFKYQAIARDKTGQVIASQKVSLSVDLLKEDQERVYSEIHETITNEFGLIVLEIGNGTERSGDLSQVEWNSNNYYIRLGMDAEGGRNFETMGTSQLLSVPYALYAEKAGDNGLRKDLWEEHQKHIYNTNRDNVGIGTMTPITKLEVIGVITATGGNSDQWNEAYSWGNHAGAGYLTSAWSLTGNSGTDPALNFIGTTDDQPLKFRVNNWPSGEMNESTANTSFGFCSLFSNTEGHNNTAIGNRALNQNTTGVLNSAIGSDALFKNTTGFGNTAIGRSALNENTDGGINTAVGANALYANTTGSMNSAFGAYALFSNTEGYSNTAFGISSLKENTTGYGNIGIGMDALFYNTTGNSNTALGCGAGYSNSTGSGNVFLGSGAGYYETGSNKLYIANHDANPPLIYGDFSTGKVGIGTVDPQETLDVNGKIKAQGLIITDLNGTKWQLGVSPEGSLEIIPLFENCGDNLADTRDNQYYPTVLIGTQCWMAKNLNYATGNSSCYDNNSSNCDTYGRLYDWGTIMNGAVSSNGVPSRVQGICPPGWHVPSNAEWVIIANHLGGASVAGGKMKEAGDAHWHSPNTGATDESGFTALPGGSRYTNGSFGNLGDYGLWWSSTESNGSDASTLSLYYKLANVLWYDMYKSYGLSLRCLKD